MRIVRMAHASVLVLLGLMVAALTRSDASAPPSPLHIAYLGRISAQEDPVFRHYVNALDQMPGELRQRVVVHHVPALLASRARIDEAVADALKLKPDLIVAPSTATARAMRQRDAGIPVVFTSFTDPVLDDIVTSTGSREEAFAGVWMADDLDRKRVEILRDAYPGIRTVAVLMDPVWAQNTQALETLPAFGRSLGLEVRVLLADDADAALRLLDDPAARAFDAWCLPPTGLANLNAHVILQRLREWQKPVIAGYTRDVASGAPLSYMADNSFRWPAMVELTTRVLQGERPGAIPIQRPYKTLLAARPAAAGFPPPSPQVVQRADLIYR
jgi:putative ABC transport system substrate-binding protein